MRRHTATLVLIGGLAASVAVLSGFLIADSGRESLQLATRYTARTSFGLFLVAFSASSLHARVRRPWSAWLVRERRGLGLAFATAHLIHLGFLVSYFSLTPAQPAVVTMAAGGLGYVGLVAMVLTSNDAAVRALGAVRWRRLHTAVGWYIWLIFLLTYGPHVPAKPGYAVAIGLLVLGAAARATRNRPAVGVPV